ncbi:MAG TPA: hypothetical protein VFB38_07235 [Chthonomonadaceae bacterium]|nr:hypothetical protein [Chthonomonadaceae bacterium]
MSHHNEHKKKDGQRKEKITKRSKEAQKERARSQHEIDRGNDQGDFISQYKPGTASDRTRTGAT